MEADGVWRRAVENESQSEWWWIHKSKIMKTNMWGFSENPFSDLLENPGSRSGEQKLNWIMNNKCATLFSWFSKSDVCSIIITLSHLNIKFEVETRERRRDRWGVKSAWSRSSEVKLILRMCWAEGASMSRDERLLLSIICNYFRWRGSYWAEGWATVS